MSEQNYADSILEAGRLMAQKVEVINTDVAGPYMLVPEGIKHIDLAERLAAPRRLVQTVTVDTEQSFVDYVKLFADATAKPVVFASLRGPDPRLLAVLDYHPAPGKPSWNGHKAVLALKFSRAFQEWYGQSGKAMTQADFAAFIENHIGQIASPDGTKLHEMCLKFEATKSVEFKSHQRVADGSVQFTYNEDVQGTVIGKEMKLPAEIVLAMPMFDGSPAVQIVAKLRFRVGDGGRLSVWFDLATIQATQIEAPVGLQDGIDAQRTAVAERVAVALELVVRGVIYAQP